MLPIIHIVSGLTGIINYNVVWEDRIRTTGMAIGFMATLLAMVFLAVWLHYELYRWATYACLGVTILVLVAGVSLMTVGYGYFEVEWLVKLLE